MAIYNLIGGTASKLNITLYGGYGDVVTLTNVRNGQKYENINLGSSMKKEIEIKSGTYSISSTHLSSTKVSLPNIEIKKDITNINIYPEGAIFWFGNGDANGDTLWSKCGGFTDAYQYFYPSGTQRNQLTENTLKNNNNNFQMKMRFADPNGKSRRVGGSMNMVNKINHSSYSKLRIQSSGAGIFYSTNSAPSTNQPYTPISSGYLSSSLSLSPASYLSYYYDDYTNLVDATITIDAIWLE